MLQGSAENHDDASIFLVSHYYKRLFERRSVTLWLKAKTYCFFRLATLLF